MNLSSDSRNVIRKYSINVPAKVNLFLHVVGKTLNGYHLIESVFVFVALYDTLEVTIGSREKGVCFTGGDAICEHDNTVQRSIDYMVEQCERGIPDNVHVRVCKNIPVSAGLAGGSADAAGVINLLGELWNMNKRSLKKVALRVGSDVPVCLKSKTAFVSGIGDDIRYISDTFLPKHIVLVRPNTELKTKSVFSLYDGKNFSEKISNLPEDRDEWLDLIRGSRNDLTDIAVSIVPEIGRILDVLRALDGCFMARMSGSGATCFALFHDEELSNVAANYLRSKYKEWYVHKTEVLTSGTSM